MNRVTANPVHQRTESNESEFELYSDRHFRLFSCYDLSDRLVFRPKLDTPTINLKQLKEILLSKDLSRDKELDWISNGQLRFLDGEDIDGDKVCFQSFPRAGNTMLRRFLEAVTGVHTGSDMPID